ncbi:MAG: DUF4254 domain-containing protein [Gammaproteobacteria bacterium]
MNIENLVQDIKRIHRDSTIRWQNSAVQIQEKEFLQLIEENHAFNFQLWQAEDRARREDMGHSFVYEAKRAIDYFNQQRNNRMEAIDDYLANTITLSVAETCPVHSETPGMIIDRLSILSLKSHYMLAQTRRETADETHRQLCTQKFRILQAQHTQLTECLQNLLQDVILQIRTFRRYHQFKMYNDPSLNPELYS